MTKRRSFLFKLSTLFGVAVAGSQVPLFQTKEANSTKEVVLTEPENTNNVLIYKIRKTMIGKLRKIHNVDKFVALKKAYAASGRILNTSQVEFTDFFQNEIKFDTHLSKKMFLNAYYGATPQAKPKSKSKIS